VELAVGLDWLDPATLLSDSAGAALWIALAVIFAECGLLVGFFLPGDTLLFTVGLFVSQGLIDHPIWWVCLVLTAGAVVGNLVGYEIGRAVGAPIFDRGRGKLLNPKQVQRTSAFFDRYGGPAIILARFVPVVRTFITVTAGVARMDRRVYLFYSTVGAIVWVWGITLLAWSLGGLTFVQEVVQPHLDLIVLGAVGISILPMAVHLLSERRQRRRDETSTVASGAAAGSGADVERSANGATAVAPPAADGAAVDRTAMHGTAGDRTAGDRAAVDSSDGVPRT
jgi:membrane protein DedA with SNARE-associated domain